MRHTLVLAGLAAAATAVFGPTAVAAQDRAEGAALYARFCATCHGADARGTGPTAEIMSIAPTDLTGLAAANEGVFPLQAVVFQIDGRSLNVAHGGPMPVFGPFFEGDDTALKTASGQPLLTSRPIADLVAWIESQQVQP